MAKENNQESFKCVESLDQVDLSQMELLRGDTPPGIEHKCLKLCQDYLSGNWCQQTVDTIRVRRVTGGLTNQLFHCSIGEPDPSSAAPQEVVVMLYGRKYWSTCGNETNERLSDAITCLLVSQNKLGPRIYGIFEQGQIQQFYKHRQFRFADQTNEKVVRQVFQKLARIHSLEVPIKRHTDWLFEAMDKDYKICFECSTLEKELQECNCLLLRTEHFPKEMEWCRTAIASIGSPIVFTHNDYRSSNIMITEPDDEVVVCDFEYGTYGYRGNDLVDILREWGRADRSMKTFDVQKLPEDSVFLHLFGIYAEECQRIHGKDWSQSPINSVEHILKEAKVFLLNFFLFGILFMLKNDPDKDVPLSRKACLELSELIYTNYFKFKKILLDQNVIQIEPC